MAQKDAKHVPGALTLPLPPPLLQTFQGGIQARSWGEDLSCLCMKKPLFHTLTTPRLVMGIW